MRTVVAAVAFTAVLTTSVVAQAPSSPAALLQALNAANLTALANAAQQIANTSIGQTLLTTLLNGSPSTIFAPNNNAFTGVPSNISSDPTLLAEVLSYHFLPGTFNTSSFFNNSNTVGKTFLNASDQVFLGPGNQHQAIAAKLESDGKVHILNQNTPVTIVSTLNSTGNFTIHIVDAVIDLPGDLPSAIFANNLTAFASAASAAGLLDPLTFQHGVTIFAPTNAAFEAILPTNGSAGLNVSTITSVLKNHIVNGSVVYSPQLAGSSLTSAGGEPFKFNVTANGTSVQSGDSTAKITVADLVLWNGVVHIIDAVLANTANNTGAASSAFQSATSAAAASATATSPSGPLGSPAPGGVSSNGSSSTNGSSSASASSPALLSASFSYTSFVAPLILSALASVMGGMMVL